MKKIILFLLLSLGIVFTIQAQNFTHRVPSPALRAHRDVQDYSSYPKWKKEQPSRRKRAIKAAAKQRKKIARHKRRVNNLIRYENRVRTRIIRTN